MLRLHTLGGLRVVRPDGEVIVAFTAQRRPAALVSVLGIAGDRGASRDKLLGILWPDADPERARHSLTQAMYAARRAVGVEDLFLTTGQLSLNPQRIVADVDELERALDAGELESAVALYDGPFLDGFYLSGSSEFEQWATTQRARIEDRVAAALEQLAERADANDDHRGAVDYRRRLCAIRPLDSTSAARLLKALARSGDRAGAIRHAHVHETLLRQQLDLAPDTEFTALVNQLREPGISSAQRTSAPVASDSVPAFQASRPSMAPAPIPESPPQPLRRRLPATWRRVAIAAAGLLLVAAGIRAIRGRGNVATTATASARPSIVIVPFTVAGASTSMAHLGPGLAQLLAARFDDDTLARVIDVQATLTAWRAARFDAADGPPRDSILRFAQRLGASRVVTGSVVGTRTRAVVTANVLAVPGGETLGTATVEADGDSLSVLADAVAAGLMVSEAGDDPKLARSWTRSTPALRDFLAGRVAYRNGEYASAARHFAATVRADSTLALAALELAVAADRLGDLDQTDAAIARAWSLREQLDSRDLPRLVALAGPSYPDASSARSQLGAWEQAVRIAPRRAQSWYGFAVRLVRDGARLGSASVAEQTTAALNRALTLDPEHAPSRQLLLQVRLAAADGVDSALANTVTVDSAMPLTPFLEWRLAVVRGDVSGARRVRDRFGQLDRTNLRAIAMSSLFDGAGLDDGARAIAELAARSPTTAERVDAELAAHSMAVNRGRFDEAMAATVRLHALRPDSHAHLRLRVLDAIYGDGDSTAASAAIEELSKPVDSVFAEFALDRVRQNADACVAGQWRLARGDTSGVRALIGRLRAEHGRIDPPPISASPAVCADLLDASLAVATRRRDAMARVQHLDSLVLNSTVAGSAAAYAHLAISRLYARLGDPRRAALALEKRTYMAGWPTYLATTWREAAQLADAVGDSTRAQVAHRRYTAMRGATEPVIESSRD